MPKIKHIVADVLSDEELTAVESKLRTAERRMDEKLMEEIDRREKVFGKTDSGIWIPSSTEKDDLKS